MFTFAFKARKSQQDLKQFLLRLINQAAHRRATICEDQRGESRVNLNLGVWIVPLSGGRPDADASFSAVTKDLNSEGIAVLANHPLSAEEVLVRLPCEPVARFVRAKVANSKELGSGWMVYNLAAVELPDEDAYSDLLC